MWLANRCRGGRAGPHATRRPRAARQRSATAGRPAPAAPHWPGGAGDRAALGRAARRTARAADATRRGHRATGGTPRSAAADPNRAGRVARSAGDAPRVRDTPCATRRQPGGRAGSPGSHLAGRPSRGPTSVVSHDWATGERHARSASRTSAAQPRPPRRTRGAAARRLGAHLRIAGRAAGPDAAWRADAGGRARHRPACRPVPMGQAATRRRRDADATRGGGRQGRAAGRRVWAVGSARAT